MNRAGIGKLALLVVGLIFISSCSVEFSPPPDPPDQGTGERADGIRIILDTSVWGLGAQLRVYKERTQELVTQDTWESNFPNCGRPYMEWYLIDVYADTIDRIVKYDRVFERESGYDMWDWLPYIPKGSPKMIQWGTWYFQVRLVYDSVTSDNNVVTRYQISDTGIHLLPISAFYHVGNPAIETAEKYIRVPYVLGYGYDEYNDLVGKPYHNGYFGLDCSGLACYAYMALGENLDVNTDNATRLREYYLKPDLGIEDVEEGDLIFVNPHGSKHVMVVGTVSTDPYHEHFIIHATASTQPERANPDSSWYWYHNNPRSVVIEHISYRMNWWESSSSDFRGIGRLPRNSKEITQRRKNMFN